MRTSLKNPYACGLCSRDFLVPRLLVKHVNIAHNPPSTPNKSQPNVQPSAQLNSQPKVLDKERLAIVNNKKWQHCSKDELKLKEEPTKVSQADTNPKKVEKDNCDQNSDQSRDQEKDKLVFDNLVQDNFVQHNHVQDNLVQDNLVQDNLVQDNLVQDNLIENNFIEDNEESDESEMYTSDESSENNDEGSDDDPEYYVGSRISQWKSSKRRSSTKKELKGPNAEQPQDRRKVHKIEGASGYKRSFEGEGFPSIATEFGGDNCSPDASLSAGTIDKISLGKDYSESKKIRNGSGSENDSGSDSECDNEYPIIDERCEETFLFSSEKNRKKEFLTKKSMLHHSKPKSCMVCSKTFSDKYVLKRHETIHTRKNQFPCKFCYKKFPKKENLKGHQNSLQCKIKSLTQKTIDEKKKYSCKTCNNVYLSKKSLLSHEKVHRNPNLCKFCSKPFKDKYTLQRHVRMHTGEKPFSCNMCYKQFSQKSSLKQHQGSLQCRIKSQNKETSNKKEKYSCKICNKVYLSKGSFQSHEKLHNNPHTCIFCSKEFSEKHFLETHERIHTGEKPFPCNFCKMKFTQQHHLKSHELNRHSV